MPLHSKQFQFTDAMAAWISHAAITESTVLAKYNHSNTGVSAYTHAFVRIAINEPFFAPPKAIASYLGISVHAIYRSILQHIEETQKSYDRAQKWQFQTTRKSPLQN